MASLRTKLEDQLECSLCLERLKDPRVFPCQHSFCYQCIVDLSQGKSKISCPECRAEVEVGDPPDLSHFKRNHRINNILECMNIALQRSTNSEAHQESKTGQTPICNDGTVQNTQPGATAQSGNDGQELRKNASKENSPSAPQTEADIVKMESEFQRKFKAQVIREQEQLFEKIEHEEKQKMAKKQQYKAGIGTSLDEHCKSKKENQPNGHHVSQINFQVSHRRDQMNYPPMANEMDVGSMVEVLSKNQNPIYGVIRWLGFLPSSDKKIAGLELEEEMNACSDGTFLGQRYFTCPSRRSFFVHLHNCSPDSRFNRNSIENPASRRLTEGGKF